MMSCMPEGYLVKSCIRGYLRYYRVVNGKKKYLTRDDEKTLSMLAQKQYVQKLLDNAVAEKNRLIELRDSISGISFPDRKAVLDSMGELAKYVKPVLSESELLAENWINEEFCQHDKTDKHRFETMSKDMVRSKSEVLIADRLYTAGIPFKYEMLLELGNGFIRQRYYPDFTIMNKRTGKIYYWEHLGMMGDKGYCLDSLGKLDDYAKYGILPGKNLILSFECEGKPLSTSYVNKVINYYLK